MYERTFTIRADELEPGQVVEIPDGFTVSHMWIERITELPSSRMIHGMQLKPLAEGWYEFERGAEVEIMA